MTSRLRRMPPKGWALIAIGVANFVAVLFGLVPDWLTWVLTGALMLDMAVGIVRLVRDTAPIGPPEEWIEEDE